MFENPLKGLAIDVDGLSQQDSQYYNETESEHQHNFAGDFHSNNNSQFDRNDHERGGNKHRMSKNGNSKGAAAGLRLLGDSDSLNSQAAGGNYSPTDNLNGIATGNGNGLQLDQTG